MIVISCTLLKFAGKTASKRWERNKDHQNSIQNSINKWQQHQNCYYIYSAQKKKEGKIHDHVYLKSHLANI